MKSKRRKLRPEIRELIDKAEMITLLALWAYIGIRCFLFVIGVDL